MTILPTFVEMPGARTRAIVDGWVFPDDIQAIFEDGRQNPVPVIVGSNADEGTMSGYWINFATTGDPTGEGLPDWPAYDRETEAFMEFGDTIRQDNHLLEKQCDFFEHFNAAERAKP